MATTPFKQPFSAQVFSILRHHNWYYLILSKSCEFQVFRTSKSWKISCLVQKLASFVFILGLLNVVFWPPQGPKLGWKFSENTKLHLWSVGLLLCNCHLTKKLKFSSSPFDRIFSFQSLDLLINKKFCQIVKRKISIFLSNHSSTKLAKLNTSKKFEEKKNNVIRLQTNFVLV